MRELIHAIALPVDDRQRSATFYRALLELEPFGPEASDGLPEPLQFRMGAAATLLLVPAGGFGWMLDGPRSLGSPEVVRQTLTWVLGDEESVRRATSRAVAAGGSVAVAPAVQPWQVFTAVVADPDGHLWVLQDRTP